MSDLSKILAFYPLIRRRSKGKILFEKKKNVLEKWEKKGTKNVFLDVIKILHSK